jgi:hypothetical protein
MELIQTKKHIKKWDKVPHACPATNQRDFSHGVEQCSICGRVLINNCWDWFPIKLNKLKNK